jgi:HlyD family secretion protein
VYVLTDSNDGQQHFKKRIVTTGVSDGIDIEIKKGLKQGEKIRGIEIIE